MKSARTFPAVATSVMGARQFAIGAVDDVPYETLDSVVLIVSELTSNSVQHAAMAFEVRIEQLADKIRIEVEDHGPGDPVARSPDLTEASGRGLQIVGMLAHDWGVKPTPGGRGKTVWASVDVPGSDPKSGGTGGQSNEFIPEPSRPGRSRGANSPGSRPAGRSMSQGRLRCHWHEFRWPWFGTARHPAA